MTSSEHSENSPSEDTTPVELEETTPAQQEQSVQVSSMSLKYQGPLPLPDFIRQYEEICPGSAERIIAMSEKEQDFRHEITRATIPESVKFAHQAQYCSFVLCALALISATLIGIWGNPWIAGGIGISGFILPLIGLVLRIILNKDESTSQDDPEE